jgi:hypothetical protein
VSLEAGQGALMRIFGIGIDASASSAWWIAGALFVAGCIVFWKLREPFLMAWNDAHTELDRRSGGGK